MAMGYRIGVQSLNSNKTLMWSMVYLDSVINVVCSLYDIFINNINIRINIKLKYIIMFK
jgi:hypothetical protein